MVNNVIPQVTQPHQRTTSTTRTTNPMYRFYDLRGVANYALQANVIHR